MESGTFASEAVNEASHWWFVGRRRLFAREIIEAKLPRTAKILDVGTSTGTNLRMLRDIGFADVEGLDFSEEAISYCASKGLGVVKQGDICAMPFPEGTFDLVLATDIIEHVDDDLKALSEIARVLKPGGLALVTVPAFRVLWGLQDRVAQHKRRYVRPELLSRIRKARLHVEKVYYFNYLLFLPIFAARRLIDLFGVQAKSEAELNSRWMNWFLERIFTFDVLSARHIKPPFGVSILAFVSKPAIFGKDRGEP
ncbi:class I SAM-dependent methyltransferase [Microvirga brassicacearum]|uniref:Class I SAM-dependent methyltransferase n=1 Tax=Microvirga brassicacearum TaxID=2580413 RepID=A0A5N3PIZ0_9HYPH|nr:class I SAM-dependent methyltransferase [Microvirga brassicacearum]KAB0269707.1 class I SAM-dependent methyltransferase [Microvirga brassicacearum]